MRKEKSGYSLNLASKPFVNMALPVILASLFVLALLAFSGFNLWVLFSNTIKGTDSQEQISAAEDRIALLKQDIDEEDKKLNAFNIPLVSKEVASANEIIRQRSMSWTRLFDRLEVVSPGELRMLQISPAASKELIDLNLRVEVPKQDVLREFMESLDKSEFFSGITVRSETVTKKGTQVWELSLKYIDAQ